MRSQYHGFTLLESVVALTVTMGLLIFVTPFISLVNNMSMQETKRDYLELQIGKKQLDHDIKKLKFKGIEKGNKLEFYMKPKPNKSEVVEYSQYKEMLRQTPGHQPLIQDIADVSFREYEQMIEMTITLIGGDTFVYFLDKGGL